MLKIVTLYLCWTILLVSGDKTSSGQLIPNGSSTQAVVKEKVSVNVEPEPMPTPDPVTTTQPPETTTPIVTTSPKPTSPVPDTTTNAPPNTTTVIPITTPTPPTPPAPKTGKWVVNGTNATCIVVRMSVQFNITYLTKDNKTEHQMLTLPSDNSSVATGDCGAKMQTLNITWHGGNDTLTLHFVKNETTKHYYMHHVQVSLESNDFPNAKSNVTLKLVHEPDQFTTTVDNSYRCMRLQKLSLTQNGTVKNGTIGWLQISDLQFQAFKTDKADNFGFAEDCQSPDVVPDVVPIAVGCVLTVLVILVLVAYLLGRRRSQARGYLSM